MPTITVSTPVAPSVSISQSQPPITSASKLVASAAKHFRSPSVGATVTPPKTCETCKKPIFGVATEAAGKSYHTECFICGNCKAPLTGRYAFITGKHLCETCAKASVKTRPTLNRSISTPHISTSTPIKPTFGSRIGNSSGAQSGTMGLLQWCKNRTQGYSGVEVTNFTTSFANGLALCAIVHSYNPSAIPFNTLRPENKLANCKLAIDTAEAMGVNRLLDPEDIADIPVPEKLSMMTYLSEMYKIFKKLES